MNKPADILPAPLCTATKRGNEDAQDKASLQGEHNPTRQPLSAVVPAPLAPSMLPWLGEMVPNVLQQGPGKSNQPQAMEGRIYASCQKKNKKRRKERHLRKQRNHHRSRQKGRKSQQWARVGVNNRATRGEGEVEKQKCSNPTDSSQEGPKGNLSLRVTLPPSWSMHCAGRAPVRGLPRDIGLHCGPGCCGREQSNGGAMEISRDLQVKAASRRRKAFTWDVE